MQLMSIIHLHQAVFVSFDLIMHIMQMHDIRMNICGNKNYCSPYAGKTRFLGAFCRIIMRTLPNK